MGINKNKETKSDIVSDEISNGAIRRFQRTQLRLYITHQHQHQLQLNTDARALALFVPNKNVFKTQSVSNVDENKLWLAAKVSARSNNEIEHKCAVNSRIYERE